MTKLHSDNGGNGEFLLQEMKEYLSENIHTVIPKIDTHFEEQKDYISEAVLKEIRRYVYPIPAHYEIAQQSNSLVAEGFVDINLTINDFFLTEYSGNRIASCCSGCALYDTYVVCLSEFTKELGNRLMTESVCLQLADTFNCTITSELRKHIVDYCEELDIDTRCRAYDYMFCENVISFIGIGDITLAQVINEDI